MDPSKVLQEIINFPGAKYLVPLVQSSNISEGIKTWLLAGKIPYKSFTLNALENAAAVVDSVVSATPRETKCKFVSYIIDYIKTHYNINDVVQRIKLVIAVYNMPNIRSKQYSRKEKELTYQLYWILTGECDEHTSNGQLTQLITNFIVNPESIMTMINIPDDVLIDKIIAKLPTDVQIGNDKLLTLSEILPKIEQFKPYLVDLNLLFKPLASIPVAPEVPTIK